MDTRSLLLIACVAGCATEPVGSPGDVPRPSDVVDAATDVALDLPAAIDLPVAVDRPADAPRVDAPAMDVPRDVAVDAATDRPDVRDVPAPPDAPSIDAGPCRAPAAGRFDVEVRGVVVTLRATINGAAPEGSAGGVELRDPASGDVAWLGYLGASVPRRTMVIPGTYDVYAAYDSTSFDAADRAVRNTRALIRRGVRVDADGDLAVDIRAVTVSGRLTHNGAPASGGGGRIVLRDAATGDEAAVASFGGPTYSARVVPGTYDVEYRGGAFGGPVANSVVRLRSAVAVAADTALDLDLRSIELRGALRTARAAVSGGQVELRDPATGSVATLGEVYTDIVVPGSGTYYARVAPGVYDLYFTNPRWDLNQGAVRNTGARFQTGVRFDASRTFDARVPSIRIAGRLTVNGVTQPGGGRIYLRANDDEAWFGYPNEARAEASIVPGVYDAFYVTVASTLSAGVVRNRSARVRTAMSFLADGTYDIDTPAVTVTGRVTVNGAPAPSGPGTLSLRDPITGDQPPLASTANAGPYTALVVPGTYDLVYDSYLFPLDNAAVRNVGLVLRRDVAVRGTTTLDADVRATTLTGAIRLNGGLTGGLSNDGRIQLRRRGAATEVADLGAVSAARYTALIAPGAYEVVFVQRNPRAGSSASAVNTAAVLGCVVVP